MAVPVGRYDHVVRTFRTFTRGVDAVRDWLLECNIKTAAHKLARIVYGMIKSQQPNN